MTGVFMRRGEETWGETSSDVEKQRELCVCKRGRAQECQRCWKQGEAQTGSPQSLQRGHSPTDISISDFQPENCKRILLC